MPKSSRDGIFENLIADAVLKRLEQVSLSENTPAEWWIVRQSAANYEEFGKCSKDKEHPYKKSKCEDKFALSSQSWSWKTIDPNVSAKLPGRSSDYSGKLPNRSRISGDDLFKNESKANSSKSSKSYLSVSSNVVFKTNYVKQRSVLSTMEEELYIKGCTAVWSKGILSTSVSPVGMQRATVCTYSMETTIKHALWCTFYLEWPSFISEEIWNKPDEPLGESIHSICLIDSNSLRVFTEKGEDFRSSLPFQISGVWNTKFGLLLERQVSNLNHQSFQTQSLLSDYETCHPLIYSLNHPLDEFCPVALKSNIFKILNTSAFKIIFMNCDPSICFVYDMSSGQHCIFLYRRLQYNEYNEITVNKSKISTPLPSSVSISQRVKQTLSLWTGQGIGLPVATGSPFGSKATSLCSLVSPLDSRAPSPMAQISRCQSPCASPIFGGVGWHNKGNNIIDETVSGSQMDHMTKQTNPEYCFELIWTENTCLKSSICNGSGPASKAFISSDMVGQKYVCYLLPAKVQLVLIRMDSTNENNLIFGTFYCITAKDAVPVPSLDILAVLDSNCCVLLYSGPAKIGKVHVGGVSAELSASPLVMRNLPSYFKSTYPRRSSLLPNSNATPIPKFDEHLLSPVPPAISNKESQVHNIFYSTMLGEALSSVDTNNNLVGLRDAIADRITLQYSDNTFCRISLPHLTSGTLVEDCLHALRQSLQRDIAMTLLCKWYATRNAPGPADLSADQEFQIFSSLLLSRYFFTL